MSVFHSVQHYMVLCTYVRRRFSSRNPVLICSLTVANVLYFGCPFILMPVLLIPLTKEPQRQPTEGSVWLPVQGGEVMAARPPGSDVLYLCCLLQLSSRISNTVLIFLTIIPNPSPWHGTAHISSGSFLLSKTFPEPFP